MRRRSLVISAYQLTLSKPKGGVDLGLPSKTRWASCNVGAITPEQFGVNYGNSYSYDNTYVGSAHPYPTDEDIRAYVGSDFRLPSPEEIEELCEYCSCSEHVLNGVNGHLFTGPNGNSIFLPANHTPEIFSGRYWSNTREYRLRTDGEYCGLSPLWNTLISGHYAVRPVCN